jgi:hypothetical protein
MNIKINFGVVKFQFIFGFMKYLNNIINLSIIIITAFALYNIYDYIKVYPNTN